MDRTKQMKKIHSDILQDIKLKQTIIMAKNLNTQGLINEIKCLNNEILKYMSITNTSISYINFGNELSNILKKLHLISGFLWIGLNKKNKFNKDNDDISELKNMQQFGLELFESKNQNYGDAFNTYGIIGILIRIGDKVGRLITLSKHILLEDSCDLNFDNESVIDTLIDLSNYSAMALMLIEEKRK